MNTRTPAALLVGLLTLASSSWSASAAPGQQATNPILFADVPDVAVIRVGDTYYMSSTTMHMAPGVPIMKSHDLVDWDLIAYAYDTLDDNDALNLANGANAYGRGSWASSLRHHGGQFYVTTFSSTTGKTHVYTTRDPEKGPWRANAFKPSLHDSSLFFDDDGRVYMVYGGGDLRLVELTADVSGVKPGGVDQVIVTDASRVAGDRIMLRAEGSQLIKHDGKYYLFNITWPRGGVRTQIVHRAEKITGPYEGRVVLSDQGVAQGTIVDTPEGDWYALLFQDYSAVGRTPFLVPVHWEAGWPVFGVDGKAPTTLDLPADPDGLETLVGSDEFDRAPGDRPLPLAWQWNHNPVAALWSLNARPGWLRLTTGRTDDDFLQTRNTLTQRTFGPESAATTRLDTSGMKPGDYAGLGVLQRHYGVVGVRIDAHGKSLVLTTANGDEPVEEARLPLSQDVVELRVECDFSPRGEDQAYFAYRLDEQADWIPLGAPLKMRYTLPHFMGYRFAFFNLASEQAGGAADFNYFRISDTIESGK
ncbi:glycoside hydrolase family 43 protein [Botrimarina colliarenosi]|uniref:glycoside hydrolase family 43 protein n=1 Tax=Botrimarina colliarenosi TaxID=2528001 RepID=UPI001E4BD48C|nr:glycoside hydrolase 43 family protein [Botrimarina colliarenosi]